MQEEKTTSKSSFLKWFGPLIQALRDLGGSATPAEVRNKIIENEHLTQDQINEKRGKTKVNKFDNEVAFARTYLVSAGYIDKSIHGIWTLTGAGKMVEMTDALATDIFKTVAKDNRRKKTNKDALSDNDVDTVHYWLYAPGPGAEKWEECQQNGVMLLGWGEIGDLSEYGSKAEMKRKMQQAYDNESSYTNSAHATWQFVHEMKIGDVVFVKKGTSEILGRGIVESDYMYDSTRQDAYKNVREVRWIDKGDWTLDRQSVQKTLTDITSYGELVQKIKALFEADELDVEEEAPTDLPEYTREDFLKEVYLTENEYDRLTGLLRRKKNVILQGAPGVGKTFIAKRLAYSMMGVKDSERVMMVQFHQSYSYEDFIMGYRPTETGFELRKGTFYNFCKKAEVDDENDYFFIIDEINRGNISKIFGELFMLIEPDKREQSLQLLYADEKFKVPENVYIIGMMNTADRSLAILDYALRRRFAFYDIRPGFEAAGFKKYQESLNNDKLNKLITCVKELNVKIVADPSLGEGFCIGHSYFCGLEQDKVNDQLLREIVEYELIPLLKEYWFDEGSKVKEWSEKLRGAIQ